MEGGCFAMNTPLIQDRKTRGQAGWSYKEAFCRNLGLISEEEQERIRNSAVAIAGMGGVGSHYLLTLMRTGFERFNVADFDRYEIVNFNRQAGATLDTVGMPKAEIMKEMALSINPQAQIRIFDRGISPENMEEFLSGVSIVLDGIDFFDIESRRLVFKEAQKRGIYAITSGPIGFSATLHVFAPGGMGFDEYFDIRDEMDSADKLIAFAVGLAPQATHLKYMKPSSVSLEKKTGPSLGLACELCSALAATEAINIVLGKRQIKAVPHFFQFDPFLQVFKKGYLLFGNKNPVQRIKRWYLKNHFLKDLALGRLQPGKN